MAGKGSRPRPIPNRAKFDQAWDNIFNKNKSKETAKASGLKSQKDKSEK